MSQIIAVIPDTFGTNRFANDGKMRVAANESGKGAMPIRNVNLTDELDRFVLKKVESGGYENPSDVVRAALRTLEREQLEYEAKLASCGWQSMRATPVR
jgi:putative addiction module CopG family antidote